MDGKYQVLASDSNSTFNDFAKMYSLFCGSTKSKKKKKKKKKKFKALSKSLYQNNWQMKKGKKKGKSKANRDLLHGLIKKTHGKVVDTIANILLMRAESKYFPDARRK